MVFDLALLVLFCVMAYRIAAAVRRESSIFLEFHQSRALGVTVLLFPLGPIVMILFFRLSPLLALIACVACYLPSLVVARKAGAAFERAGTDRVRAASAATSQAFGTSLVGLVYAAIAFTIAFATYFLRGSA
jgi:hypothetical protein